MKPIEHIGVISLSKRLEVADVARMSQACGTQLIQQVSKAWGRRAVPVTYFRDPAAIPQGIPVVAIMDTPDTPDALGYHFEEEGRILGKVFADPVLDNNGSALGDISTPDKAALPSVSSVLSHELVELYLDPDANLWADGISRPEGSQYAVEACDPVEGDSYTIIAGALVLVSNFVLPAWFDAEASKGPFDYLGKLSGPFSMSPGGYLIIRDGREPQTVFGALSPWRQKMIQGPASRATYRMS